MRWPLHVRCCKKKFTFAISSPDEFLYSFLSVCAALSVDELCPTRRSDVCGAVDFSLTPGCVTFDDQYTFCNVWAGNFGTIARTHKSEHIYVWGLNASGQLGLYCTAD